MLLHPDAHCKKVVGHRVVSSMYHLVIHGKHEHVVEELLHCLLELRHGLTIDMARAAGRRGMSLTFEGRHANNRDAMFR